MTNPLPDPLRRNISLYFGERGLRWLAGLEERLPDLARAYDLHILPPFPDLSVNYVAPALRSDGTEVVLKLGVPNPEIDGEIASLRAFGGSGAVRLLEADPASGLLLLERVRPGSSLLDLSEEEATRAAAGVIARLHRSDILPDPTLPRLEDWFEAFARHRSRFGGSGPLPHRLFDRAESTARELLASTDRPILLHGDLHHDNILAATREPWLAIDPKGVAGVPCFEVAPFMRNPMSKLHTADNLGPLLQRRFALFHEHLGYDIARMQAWVLAESVLSAVWDIDDPAEGWRRGLVIAEEVGGRS